MEFFNKKEEVIDLQLTQYGKYLLSLGKLKPVYYAFYDDNIIYDSNHMGLQDKPGEIQNNAEPRIQENTPSLKSFHNFHSIDDDLQRAVEATYHSQMGGGETTPEAMRSLQMLMNQQTPDKSQILINPLAQSDFGSDKLPAWNLKLLSGKLKTGDNTTSWPLTTSTSSLNSSGVILNIPQIEIEVKYTVSIEDGNLNISQDLIDAVNRGELDGIPQSILEQILAGSTGFDDHNYDIKVFDDGTFFNIHRDDLILQIMEDNVPYSNDNFEVEVFTVSDNTANNTANTTTVRQLDQLRFLVEPDFLIDDILYDKDELKRSPIPDIDSSFVDYFFDFETDDEIEASLICNKIKNGDKDLYKFARRDFTCQDIKSNYQFLDPYAAKSADEECGSE
tara:strand:+ start:61 stop:1233 length:1173 start_codon:yes stop_codon:yes gene_type:complete